MEFDKRKYIYITIVAVLAGLTLYVAYSLIKNGHPIDKSQKEYLRDANKLHNDSLYEEAVESYMKASEFDNQQSLVNYNIAVNSLKKNYKQLKAAFNEDGTELGQTVDSALVVANNRLKEAAIMQDDVEKYSEAFHNIGVANHMRDSLNAAAEAYKEALRKNPANENARYNLAVVLYQKKQQQQQQQQQQQDKQEKKEKEKEKEKEKQQQEKQQQQQEEQQQQDSQQQEKDEELEKIEQMLNALKQDEKELREKIKNVEGGKRQMINNW